MRGFKNSWQRTGGLAIVWLCHESSKEGVLLVYRSPSLLFSLGQNRILALAPWHYSSTMHWCIVEFPPAFSFILFILFYFSNFFLKYFNTLEISLNYISRHNCDLKNKEVKILFVTVGWKLVKSNRIYCRYASERILKSQSLIPAWYLLCTDASKYLSSSIV